MGEEEHPLGSADLVHFSSPWLDGERRGAGATLRVSRGAGVRVNSSASLPFPFLPSVRKLGSRLVIAKVIEQS